MSSKRKERHNYKSGLEARNGEYLDYQRFPFRYESLKIPWVVNHLYTPDFILGDTGIVVETKGRFIPQDRRKHLEVKAQHPDLDIRFVFTNSRSRLYKGGKRTYGDWCLKNGFKYADERIPYDWLIEKPNLKSMAALEKLYRIEKFLVDRRETTNE